MPRRLLDRVIRRLPLPEDRAARAQQLVDTEWIITNGLGGYASSTMAGVITRRYHGILVAALPNPLGRTVMLNHLGERVCLPGGRGITLNSEQRAGGPADLDESEHIAEVRLEAGLPVWEYRCENARIEKRILMPHQQNSVHVRYRLLDGPEGVALELRPAVHFRGYEDPVATARNSPSHARYAMTLSGGVHVLTVEDDVPPLRLHVSGAESTFVSDEQVTSEFVYPVEESRGYEFRGTLWRPGCFEVPLARDVCVTLIASVETEEVMLALDPDDAARCEYERRRRLIHSANAAVREGAGAELVLAADQFVITPAGRVTERVRAKALGHDIRTIIAGYHWFTDWGRDTMISLEGLTLVTGREREAGFILRTFAHYVHDGLIPNMFPDGSSQGRYNTADATLWFFHAMDRYLRCTGDDVTLLHLLPVLVDIVERHVAGTDFGIGVDPADGLLRQGAAGYQLTWMDAKVDDWVVTPRRGKAVEINALWYNALKLLEGWLADADRGDTAGPIGERAKRVYESFNERFWIADAGYCYDVVDGEPDAAGGSRDSRQCRPNQLFSVSLAHPVLEPSRWAPMLDVVQRKLVTPVGLRTLAPDDPDYKKKYFGDLRARDAAYHQGTVWAWLIGPWIDAWLKVHPDDREGARRFLGGCVGALGDFGLGTIGEIFDAEPPYTPRGCIAQAWSVAETLRAWAKTAPATNDAPPNVPPPGPRRDPDQPVEDAPDPRHP